MRKTKLRVFINANKWYTVIDNYGRIIIPINLLPQTERGLIDYSIYLNEDKIILEKMKSNTNPANKTVRVTIPYKIRKKIGIKENDVFEIKNYSNGFILERTDGGLIEQ